MENMFFIYRNIKEFGPFSSDQIIELYKEGFILSKDQIRHENTDRFILVYEFLKINHLVIPQNSEKVYDIFRNLLKQTPSFIKFWVYLYDGMQSNKELIIIISIVITPIIGLYFVQFPLIVYGIYGLYFAAIWSLIIFKTIATSQVNFVKTLVVFIGTILFSVLLISAIHSSPIGSFLKFHTELDNFLFRFIAMFMGVAIIEEFCKQILIYWIIYSNKFVTSTRTALYYGMIAGIAFGIFEGVEYQIGINKEMGIDENYFFNILRLTSLPFFHAIWSGIGAYILSLSFIIIKFRYSFRIIALLIPSLFHAVYNTFGLTILGVSSVIVSFLLLIIYLTRSNLINNQINLKNHEQVLFND
jgi:protease PrsW